MKFRIIVLALFLFSLQHSYAQISGCNDNPASNYQSSATQNNGTCTYAFTMMYPTLKYNPGNVLSQIAGSIVWNDTLWAINDHSGPYLYALDTSNSASPVVKRTIQIAGASVIDWEEITQDENYIYIGDVGNNIDGNRTDLKIYKISKYDIQHNSIVTPQVINFSYADQTIVSGNTVNNTDFDCESFFIINNKIYLFTKQWISNGTAVYEIPSVNAGSYSATKIHTYPTGGLITGGDIIPNSRIIVLAGYTVSYERFIYLLYDFSGTNFFGGNVRKINMYNSYKTEAISFRNSNSIYLGSEFVKMPPSFPDILQRIEVLDITALLSSYYQKLALPINYIQFKSKISNNSVLLNWEVFPNDEFVKGEVQRKFISNGTYQTVSSMKSYSESFTDNDVLIYNPLVFYRLKVYDKDNKINYSKELSINKKDIKTVLFSVINSALVIDADNKLGGTIKIIQTDGKVISQSSIIQKSSTININSLPTGVYVAIVQQAGTNYSYRFYKGL
ncbi:MAG: T9SS type A sorting domain-containing protein [Chitinophagaceae bacterium]|nr:T9SS type A sorting domain-containing protein [Chitinophagaceae bacterium]